jgi:FlgN protein
MRTNELIQHLEDMTKNYRLLLELVRSEKQILIDAVPEKIDQCLNQKESLLSFISEQDVVRQTLARQISHELGLNADEPRLLEIAKHLKNPESDKLRSQHAALELIIKRLMLINAENAHVAQLALKNVTMALDNLKETFMGQKTYQKKGHMQNGTDRSGNLVSREA